MAPSVLLNRKWLSPHPCTFNPNTSNPETNSFKTGQRLDTLQPATPSLLNDLLLSVEGILNRQGLPSQVASSFDAALIMMTKVVVALLMMMVMRVAMVIIMTTVKTKMNTMTTTKKLMMMLPE